MRTLIIGDLLRWAAEGRDIAGSDAVIYAGLEDVTRTMLEAHDPEIVLSPLVADSFDACDVAAVLADAEFAGRYCAVSHQTTNKAVIMSEIAHIAPELDFDIIEIK
jgi:hypothetical protein